MSDEPVVITVNEEEISAEITLDNNAINSINVTTVIYPEDTPIYVSEGVANSSLNAVGSAGVPISVYQVLVLFNGLLYPANVFNAAHAGLVVGVARNSSLIGGTVEYTQIGKMAGTLGLTPGAIYIGNLGAISLTPYQIGAAWSQQIGVAESANSFVVDLGIPIFR